MFNFFLSQKRLILSVLPLFFLFSTLQFLYSRRMIRPGRLCGSGVVLEPGALDLPSVDYPETDLPACTDRLGLAYLDNLRESRAQYCSPASPSQLMCFHSRTAPEGRLDSFCVGQNAVFNPSLGKFQFSCERVDPREVESNQKAPALDDFPTYWYHTGPRQVFNDFIDLDAQVERNEEIERIIILVKREGAGNVWHSLMEIMSTTMTLDVLQMTRSVGSQRRIISAEDALRTQVVIVDSHTDGPYFELWRILAKMPVVRLSDLSTGFNSSLVVVPLPGGSNPIWQADWEPTLCHHSDLLQTFAWRVRQHLNISDPLKLPDQVVVTIIERKGTRKLIDQHARIEALRKQYPASEVFIQLIDFAVLPFQEQIQIIRGTDVLVGVHGAGLTHGLWLPQRSAMVEILPEDLQHKGFRNLAGVLGHDYFSTHASKLQTSSRGANDNTWQVSDVALDEERWLQLINVAIKSMYNKGRHNFDVAK
jgi:protein O-GlcNAc transferase